MQFGALAPGVYQEVVQPAGPADLPTGIVGFIGFAATPGPVMLSDARAVAGIADPAVSFLPAILGSFFANGGGRCHVAGASAGAGNDAGASAGAAHDAAGQEAALGAALDSLAGIDEIDLVAMPDLARLTLPGGAPATDAMLRLQTRMLAHCAQNGRRFAILDSLQGASPAGVTAQVRTITAGITGPVNGALYYPWPTNGEGSRMPPCGHVAGQYASTDAAFGVARAPAGMALADVFDLEIALDPAAHGSLNDAGVNCIRSFPGRGIRLWGARTLSADPAWRYVNVRRLVLTLCRWIDVNLAWTAFEPNTQATWTRVTRVLTARLTQLWDTGALQGATAADAFYVRCDADTNPAGQRDGGRMVAELGIAPASPAEFIVIRLALQPDPAS